MTNRKVDDPNDTFVPSVTSSLNITVNEGTALIQSHDSDDRNRFEPLLKLPTKSIDSLRTLKFTLEHIEELKDQFIDLLVVVTFVRIDILLLQLKYLINRNTKKNCNQKNKNVFNIKIFFFFQIGEVRDIISRDGRNFKCRSFEITDPTTNKAVALQLWDSEWIRLSELWEPRRTVLFLADVRVGFDKFKKRISMAIGKNFSFNLS